MGALVGALVAVDGGALVGPGAGAEGAAAGGALVGAGALVGLTAAGIGEAGVVGATVAGRWAHAARASTTARKRGIRRSVSASTGNQEPGKHKRRTF
ncbi:MAG: hypothetical protein OHK0015_08460 [Chloroflexi bacterium OHK40]